MPWPRASNLGRVLRGLRVRAGFGGGSPGSSPSSWTRARAGRGLRPAGRSTARAGRCGRRGRRWLGSARRRRGLRLGGGSPPGAGRARGAARARAGSGSGATALVPPRARFRLGSRVPRARDRPSRRAWPWRAGAAPGSAGFGRRFGSAAERPRRPRTGGGRGRGRALGEPTLGGGLVEEDGPRDGRVERLDPSVHRDPDQQVAAPPHRRARGRGPRCPRRSRSARAGRRPVPSGTRRRPPRRSGARAHGGRRGRPAGRRPARGGGARRRPPRP